MIPISGHWKQRVLQWNYLRGGTVGGTCTRSLEVDDKNIVIAGYSQGDNCCVLAVSGYCGSLPKIIK